YGNGLIHSVTQNARHLPSQVRDASGSTVVHDFGYSYDANGNVTAINDVGQSGLQTRSLLYDARDRLVSATATQLWGVASYAYDPLDNLRLADQGSRQYRYQYDSNNRLTQLTDPAGAALPGLDFAYDAQGRQIRKGTQVRTFDGANRITAIDGETYAYDGTGRRIATWAADGRTKVEVYTQDGKLGFAVDSAKGGGSSFIYLAGQRIAQDHWVCPDQHTVTYFHADALGSPVATTDAAKNVLERTYYAPYGEALNRSVDGPGYTGHVMDAATGLVYAQQRYYDPVVGKFLSIDPVAADPNAGGNFNRFWYANNSPYKFTDPTGRESACVGTDGCKSFSNVTAEGARNVVVAAAVVSAAIVAAPIVAAAVAEVSQFGVAGAALANPEAVAVGAVVGAEVAAGASGAVAPSPSLPSAAGSVGADFMVTSKGTAVPVSQSRMVSGLEAAGMTGTPLPGGKGTSFTTPSGTVVRAMEPSGQAPRRASFNNSNGGPVTPDGTVPQPPRGATPAEKRDFVRDQTHVEQRQ
ncbi:MAG: RHS repeat-associated core domain-containing protein, partial [Xanthomonadaceae bacterium]|nr:RHS repeat-associated core domain-containing protein [Xanthomonadaceae bacterium]